VLQHYYTKTLQPKADPVPRLLSHRRNLAGAVAALLVAAVFSVWSTFHWADRQKRKDLLQHARLVSRMILPGRVRALGGSQADLSSTNYVHLKEQLMRARQANSKYRFLYLLGRLEGAEGDKLFFYVDSEPAGSKDYSPPGQVYEEATEQSKRVFDNKVALVEGPSRDRWGTWVSALVPMTDPATGELVAVLGLDMDAGFWKRDVILYTALPAGLTLAVLAGLFGFLFILLRRSDRRIAEQQAALRTSEERLQFAMEGANDGIWEIDLRTDGVLLSPRGYEMFGYRDLETFTADVPSWDRMVFPDDLPATRAALTEHLAGRTPFFCLEQRLRTRTGEYRWVLTRGKVSHRDAEGRPVRVTGTHADITERKQTEIYRQLSATILMIVNGDDDFRHMVQRILTAVKQSTGCDAVGLRLQQGEDFPYFSESGFSSDFLLVENTLISRDKQGDACRGPDGKVSLECTCGLVLAGKTDPSNPLFTPGGSFWINNSLPLLELPSEQDPRLHPRNRCIHEGFASVALIPVHEKKEIVGLLQLNARRKNGFSLQAVEALEEIADRLGDALTRKRAETERKRLMAAIEHASEVVLVTDTHGTIQYANPAFVRVTGYSREEVIGQNPRLWKSGQQDDPFYQKLWQTLGRGEVWKGRLINKRKDGSLYTEEATISPVRDEAGQIVNYVAVKRDISEQLMLMEQLLQAQKMESVGRLAGGVAHDFNNMLAVILGNTELALSEVVPTQSLFTDLQEIRKAAEHSAVLTRQLLAFARKQTVMPKVIDLNETVAGMLNMLRRLISEDIELVWHPGDGNTTVKIDPSQVDQILANLAVNARDAISDGGKLTIGTEIVTADDAFCSQHADATPGDYVMLSVTDTGCGMDKEKMSHLFEPFFTTKRVGEGTGLGLATVYGIVRQNQGFITVESKPGEGTAFRIHLPRFSATAEPAPAQNPETSVSLGKETVLLVEDEASLLNLSRTMLEKMGYRVLAAASPQEALRVAETNAGELRVLLTDMIMPEMNGQELFKRLSARLPDLKCLFMSGYTFDALDQSDLTDQSAHFIQKPFTMKELGTKLKEIIEGA